MGVVALGHEADGATQLAADREPLLLRALVDGQVSDAVITVSPQDRPASSVRCDGRALIDPDGKLLGAVVAMKDITEIRASEQRFRDAFDHGPTPMARLDATGLVEQVNPAMRRFLAQTSARLVGRSWTELAQEDDRIVLEAALHARNRANQLLEARFLRPDGTPVWCEVALTRGKDRTGTSFAFVQLLDVDARKQQGGGGGFRRATGGRARA